MNSDELVKKYANNRIALKEIKREIHALQTEVVDRAGLAGLLSCKDPLDLSVCRELWLDQDYPWQGWAAAVEDCEECSTEDQMKLAVLLDRKKSVERAAGYIKRSIYLAGVNLIKKDLGE